MLVQYEESCFSVALGPPSLASLSVSFLPSYLLPLSLSLSLSLPLSLSLSLRLPLPAGRSFILREKTF